VVVLGGGAILPRGIEEGRIAMFRSEGGCSDCELEFGGEGGAMEKDGGDGEGLADWRFGIGFVLEADELE